MTEPKRKAGLAAYTQLLAQHPDLRQRALAMIESGSTREDVVAELGAGAASAGWDKAVTKVNNANAALRGRAE